MPLFFWRTHDTGCLRARTSRILREAQEDLEPMPSPAQLSHEKWLMARFAPLCLAALLLLVISTPLASQEQPAQDPESAGSAEAKTQEAASAEDALPEKAEKERFRLLPIPILITEPAIGEGLGVALALFHPVKQGKTPYTRMATPGSLAGLPTSREAPPVVTALAAAYTNNDTWFAGLAHSNNWRNDSIRYAGALATARINSSIYLLNRPVTFSMESDFVLQDFKFRLGHSDLMLGAGLLYIDAQTRFGSGLPDNPPDDRFSLKFKDVGLTAKLVYETRDNMMNPTSGQLAELALSRFDESFGGSFDYWSWKAKALSFHPLAEKFTLGLRLAVSGVDGRTPFYAYPWVQLRGIPALRYQDKVAGAAEVEGRYLLAPRWEIAAFAGLGYTSKDVPLFDNPGSIYSCGLGTRYKVFDAHNVWMGVDIARGPEDWNWYIQVGHAW